MSLSVASGEYSPVCGIGKALLTEIISYPCQKRNPPYGQSLLFLWRKYYFDFLNTLSHTAHAKP